MTTSIENDTRVPAKTLPASEDSTSTSEFPTHSLPDSIRAFVEECAESLRVPIEMVAVPALVALGSIIGNTRVMSLKQGWNESAALYAAIVANPGSMKSAALDKAVKSILTRPLPEDWGWTSDVTVEKLAELLHRHKRGVLSVRDELAAWVKSLNQYRGGKGADKEFYLSAWSNTPIKVDRKGNPSIEVPHPFLSIVGGLTPSCLQEFKQHVGQGDGFLERILFSWPEPGQPRWSYKVIGESVQASYDQVVDSLLGIPMNDNPSPLTFTQGAQQLFIEWHDNLLTEVAQEASSDYLRGAYSKLKGYCARFAMIHALVSNPKAGQVEEASLQAGIELVEYFKKQAQKIDQALGGSGSSEVEHCKRWIERKVASTSWERRNLQRWSNCSADIFQHALEDLMKPQIVQEGNRLKLNIFDTNLN